MWPALLALGATTISPEEPAPRAPVLYVRTSEDWAPLRSGPVHAEIVPLNSRTARVPCAAITPNGIALRLWAGGEPIEALDSIEVVAVEHALDERVVDIDGEIRVLGAVSLPKSIRRGEAGADILPALARQDGSCERCGGQEIVTSPEGLAPGAELVAILDDTPRWEIRTRGPAARSMEELVWSGRSAARVGVGGRLPAGSIDQAVYATVRSPGPGDVRPLRLVAGRAAVCDFRGFEDWRAGEASWPAIGEPRGDARDVTAALASRDDLRVATAADGIVQVWYEAPATSGDGRTTMLLVTVHGGTNAWPAVPGAPRAARSDPQREWWFTDLAAPLGIEMVHFEGPDLQLDIRPTMGPGAAWGDVDGDGWVDLFLPQGGGRDGSAPPTSRCFRNDHGRFVDESEARGLALAGAGMGALFYDADGDGDLDLFVANYGRNRFLLNDGHGRFTDASAAVGLDTDMWHAAVSAADYDGDGDLDLYVTSYLRYDTGSMPGDEELGHYQREDPVEMLPFAFPGERKLLLRCDLVPAKDGAPAAIGYVDVAKDLGLDDPNGRGMQALWWDFDRDGDQDLVLANDVSPNRFWRNEGGGRFKDVGFSTGLDDPRGSMGFSAGDVDGDLDEDLFLTNWQLESNALYVNNLRHTSAKSRVSTFRDRAVEAGLGQISVGVTGWGCELADFDLDGDLDLFYANGYTSPDYETAGICVGQPCHFLLNDGAGNFRSASTEAGPDVAAALASRAAVACDYDQDGDLDLAVTANNGRFRLLRNEHARGKTHWLGIRLAGVGANTRAIGAQVVVEAGGRKLLRSLRAGTGYLSGNAPELHFGLGEASIVTSCTVRWPSGAETSHAIDGVDRFVTIAEPR